MSRAMNLSLAESTVREHCRENDVEVSALEVLPGGGVRLVCSRADGAERIRKKLKSKLISDDAQRTKLRPPRLQW